jgi:hypothetical protein
MERIGHGIRIAHRNGNANQRHELSLARLIVTLTWKAQHHGTLYLSLSQNPAHLDPDDAIAAAVVTLRSHYEGDLRFDHDLLPIKFVLTPEGRILLNVMAAMLLADETVLFVPRAEDGAMELLVTLEEAGPTAEAMTDRWRIYHGEPQDVRWAIAEIDMVRWHGTVLDGESMMSPNLLSPDEPALLRTLNANCDALRQACHGGDVHVENPVAVGIDVDGIDVRAAFGVLRLPLTEPIASRENAPSTIDRLLNT